MCYFTRCFRFHPDITTFRELTQDLIFVATFPKTHGCLRRIWDIMLVLGVEIGPNTFVSVTCVFDRYILAFHFNFQLARFTSAWANGILSSAIMDSYSSAVRSLDMHERIIL